jgi:hypothetical protein
MFGRGRQFPYGEEATNVLNKRSLTATGRGLQLISWAWDQQISTIFEMKGHVYEFDGTDTGLCRVVGTSRKLE